MKNALYLFLLTVLFFSCGDNPAESTVNINAEPQTDGTAIQVAEKPNAIKVDEKANVEIHNNWDGFYLWPMSMGYIIVIQDGKYYNFGRNKSLSFRKDHAYDIGFELNEKGYIPIVKEYYLDRNDKMLSKETVLFDTKPMIENGTVLGMLCRDKKHLKMENLSAYFSGMSVSEAKVIEAVKKNSKYQDDSTIAKALKDVNFVKKSKMTEADLRTEELEFWQLVVNIIEAK